MVEFSTGVRGLVLNLEEGAIDVVLLGPDDNIHGGDLVVSSKKRLSIPVGPDSIFSNKEHSIHWASIKSSIHTIG